MQFENGQKLTQVGIETMWWKMFSCAVHVHLHCRSAKQEDINFNMSHRRQCMMAMFAVNHKVNLDRHTHLYLFSGNNFNPMQIRFSCTQRYDGSALPWISLDYSLVVWGYFPDNTGNILC